MDYLPIFLRMQERVAVVIGGGPVAARKAALLLQCGARVTLVAPELSPAALALSAPHPGRLRHLAAAFEPGLLEDAQLVIAATDSAALNRDVARAARERGLPVNVVDDAASSTFILPAIVDRSPVVVAVGSEGSSPVLSRRLRAQIETLLPAGLGQLARLAGSHRAQVRAALPAVRRRRFWEHFFDSPAAAQALAGDEAAAATFARTLEEFRAAAAAPGEVYLIGAGPGDPDLLTLRAARLLQRADVVLYDRLVSEGVLERCRRDARRVFVGKEVGAPPPTQEHINAMLVDYALRGLAVARLKGGDPFIFGRGGEEIAVLARHGIPCTVVPGITAGLAAAAAAGIALTRRGVAQTVTFAPGHAAAAATLDWRALAGPRQTAVFYMAVAQLPGLVERLLAAGAPPARPAALVAQATLPTQRILKGRLCDIASQAAAGQVGAPALLIVGDVIGHEAVQELAQSLRGTAPARADL
ncbi:MAG TPA: siroheme synthase CysG [Steroidobacteraceae bacterium]|nr:siroheme synthase CysG [Steroidobacteraceae bacterium]